MGWTHCFDGRRKPDGTIDRKYECDRLLTWCRKDENGIVTSSGEVLKSAMVGSVYYAAVKNHKGEVFAAVFLTCGRTRWDNTAWGYKDMDETMGPNESKCPASILALLTPTDSKWANEWRERCRQNIAKAAEIRKNGRKPPFVPSGVSFFLKGHSWVITSEAYRQRVNYKYSGVKFSKAKWHEFDRAMRAFLGNYGTKEQKKEFAASGRECPPEWKGAAA
ncbi:MAG: hypothetical protein J6Q22_09415 [Prevotella sp.]|nr:hypothetical protein [Prevotella sp.]